MIFIAQAVESGVDLANYQTLSEAITNWENRRFDSISARRVDEKRVIRNMENLLKSEPYFASAWFFLGSFQYELRNYEASIVSLENALRLVPNSQTTMIKLGDAFSLSKNYDEALLLYERSKSNKKYKPIAMYKIGINYIFKGEMQSAKEIHNKLKKIDSHLAMKLYNEIMYY